MLDLRRHISREMEAKLSVVLIIGLPRLAVFCTCRPASLHWMYVTGMQINLRVSLWKRRVKFTHIPAQRFLDAFAKNDVTFRNKNDEPDWFLQSAKIESYSRKWLVWILLAVPKIIPVYIVQKFLWPKISLNFLSTQASVNFLLSVGVTKTARRT